MLSLKELSAKRSSGLDVIRQFLSSPEGSALVKKQLIQDGVYSMDGFLLSLNALAASGHVSPSLSQLLRTENTSPHREQLKPFFSGFMAEIHRPAAPAVPAAPAAMAAPLPGIPMGEGNVRQAMAELGLTEADAKRALSSIDILTTPMYRSAGSPLYHKTVHTQTTSGARNPRGANVTTFFYVLEGGAYYLVAAGHHQGKGSEEYRIDIWVSNVPLGERIRQANFAPPPKKGGK